MEPSSRTSASRFPWHAYLVLLRPHRISDSLAAIRASAIVDPAPNLWQIELGVMRMWHRIVFRSETIGTAKEWRVRPTRWARFLEHRTVRLPFLLREGSVRPWDLSGLLSTPDQLRTHLLGTHHDGHQFVYDLEMLAVHPGALERLRDEAREVVRSDTARTRWLRDLCVYERYHENLLTALESAVEAGVSLPDDEVDNPDVCFRAYLRWCASQPATPSETWRAWRTGRFTLAPPAGPSAAATSTPLR